MVDVISGHPARGHPGPCRRHGPGRLPPTPPPPRNLLVVGLRKTGQYEQAERVARETLVMREEQLGPDHPHTLLLRSDLALTLHAAGRTTGQEALSPGGGKPGCRRASPGASRPLHREATQGPRDDRRLSLRPPSVIGPVSAELIEPEVCAPVRWQTPLWPPST
ncbi:tetratricopeptide repeat protein [Streptomyces sp. 2.9]|uniref:tetratricopeptide repeat protein n=1 Tax=Streptomyces tritrimontium TaxID=3406573 RepID=UPI003BB76364